ncbi:MAG: class I SAM-dependent methyltransferase [Rhodospirillales bacterium]|nr:class I SAM-dependent methyltransferase [Rhodospirillales bacterium]
MSAPPVPLAIPPLRRFRRLLGAVWRDPGQFAARHYPRECPICSYRGMFISVGRPPRWDARCLACGSRERHRLTHLWRVEGGGDKLAGRRILHFAPEKFLMRQMRGNPLYETADLFQKGVTHRLDITALPFPDATYDVVMAHHVLEHIDADRRAMAELLRVLKPGGFAVLSVPLNGSREETYENPAITDEAGRTAHFSAPDHKRMYGRDFAARLEEVGFVTEIFRLPPEQEVRYGLLPTEWLTIAHKR